MGSDLYLESIHFEPAYDAAKHFTKFVKEQPTIIDDDGKEYVAVAPLIKWLKDYDPMWKHYEK